ncbi:hypothetical protein LCGC14_2437480, partial [marine sediment metagenome]
MVKIIHGDCIEVMEKLIAKGVKVDAIIVDPPYGTTQCKWDSIIPLEPMWECLKALRRERAAIIFMAGQPFTSSLIISNIAEFKYCWIWDKVTARGHLVAKKRPMAQHEDICVFYKKAPIYNPQMVDRPKEKIGRSCEYGRTTIV